MTTAFSPYDLLVRVRTEADTDPKLSKAEADLVVNTVIVTIDTNSWSSFSPVDIRKAIRKYETHYRFPFQISITRGMALAGIDEFLEETKFGFVQSFANGQDFNRLLFTDEDKFMLNADTIKTYALSPRSAMPDNDAAAVVMNVDFDGARLYTRLFGDSSRMSIVAGWAAKLKELRAIERCIGSNDPGVDLVKLHTWCKREIDHMPVLARGFANGGFCIEAFFRKDEEHEATMYQMWFGNN